ncbi:MAG: hypothetical protein QNJ60_04845 [Xenococcaceae cyanobacterium MO_188.B19]|nr:hypothetical protein [Xenococcaceae cyanobacterium MO_188.B19]
MLREICQEIIKLQKDPKFLRNLTLLAISTIAFCGGIAEPYHHSATSAEQERLAQISPFISAGMVIRTYQTVLDKDEEFNKIKK